MVAESSGTVVSVVVVVFSGESESPTLSASSKPTPTNEAPAKAAAAAFCRAVRRFLGFSDSIELIFCLFVMY